MREPRRVTDVQVADLRRRLQRGASLSLAALKSGMDRKSARKYKEGSMPSETRKPRTWRTRLDPLEQVWPELEELLARDPELQAVTLLGWLQSSHPGIYTAEVRRTLERRVRRWKAQHGPAKEVFFAQLHEPGRLGASDFTHMDSLGVTIAGEPFCHMLYHFVLTHSNWEHVTVCFSESFASLSEGLQNALWALGGVPSRHRTDRMTLACHKDGNPEEFTSRYRGLLEHYGMAGEATNPASGHENGDCEQSHRRLKEAVSQALLLRGSRDFASREEYETFLRGVVEAKNSRRREAIATELSHLFSLPSRRLETQDRRVVRVQAGSTIGVSGNTYSVPARLIGDRVEVRIGVEEIEVWYAGEKLQKMARLRGKGKHDINYRHVIGWLIRKPGAFARYAYREAMYPTTTFRRAYDRLLSQDVKRADRDYLQLLHLAAENGESLVEGALATLLSGSGPLTVRCVRALLGLEKPKEIAEQVSVPPVDMSQYDALLSGLEFLTVGEETDPFFKEEASDGVKCERERGSDALSAGSSFAGDANAARGSGSSGDSGVVELRGLFVGTGASGSDSPESEPNRACSEGVEVAVGEELGFVGSEATASESGAAVAEFVERGFLGSTGECAGVWPAGLGEDACVVGRGAGVSEVGAPSAVHTLWSVGARPSDSEARPDTEGDAEAAGALGGGDFGRLGVRATEPRGDGSAVHIFGGALRARERAADEQLGVFEVGSDLQGPDDDGCGGGSVGASQRVGGDEFAELPSGDGASDEVGGGVEAAGGNGGAECLSPLGRGGSASFAVATLRLTALRPPAPTARLAEAFWGKIIVANGEG